MLEINFKNPNERLSGLCCYGSWERLLKNELKPGEKLVGVKVDKNGVTYFLERVPNELCN